MEYIKEANKNLIHLRTSLITTVVILTGGIVGLLVSNINVILRIILLLSGFYFDFLFIMNIISINKEIQKNIGVLKNECK